MKPSACLYVILAVLTALPSGCSGSKTKADSGLSGQLANCPDRPNCVSSLAREARHAVAPFQLKGDAADWRAIRDFIAEQPRLTVVTANEEYLKAECKSRLFGFVDDLELRLNPTNGHIDIRSASRVGYFDLGVNRRRVETLRRSLQEIGLIR